MRNRDDGRLWVLGALGLLAVAGAARRKGSAYEILDSMGERNDLLGYGGESVVRMRDGRIVWIRVPGGLEDAAVVDLGDDMARYLDDHGIDLGHVPDAQNLEDLYACVPLLVYEIEVPDDVNWALESSDRSPLAEAAYLFVQHYVGPFLGASPEEGAETLLAMARSDDPLDRVEVLETYARAHGFDSLAGLDRLASYGAEMRTANEIISRWPHLRDRPLVRTSFRGQTTLRPWEKR